MSGRIRKPNKPKTTGTGNKRKILSELPVLEIVEGELDRFTPVRLSASSISEPAVSASNFTSNFTSILSRSQFEDTNSNPGSSNHASRRLNYQSSKSLGSQNCRQQSQQIMDTSDSGDAPSTSQNSSLSSFNGAPVSPNFELQNLLLSKNHPQQHVLQLLNQHNNDFRKHHEDMVSIRTDVNRQIQCIYETTTKHIDALHQSLSNKMEVTESRLNELERSKRSTEQGLEQLKELQGDATSSYQSLKHAHDELMKQMNQLIRQVSQLRENNNNYARTRSLNPTPTPTMPSSKRNPRKLCPHCNGNFSSAYICTHIKKYCRPAGPTTAVSLNSTTS